MTNETKSIKLNKNLPLSDVLFREQLEIPQGWKEEVYFNRKTKVLSFSSPLTMNMWSDDPTKVGEIEGITIGDFDGYYEIENGDFVEIDDGYNEIDPRFTVPDYTHFYPKSSIVEREAAIEQISDYGAAEWFTDIREQVETLAKWTVRYKVNSNVMGVRQKTANFDLRNVPAVSTHDHVEKQARERFSPYEVRVNHAGYTITVNYH